MSDKFEAKDLGSIIPGILGLGAQIGTAIPGLRKPARTNTAEGAVTAATTGAARAAAAAGGAGFGATRGLVSREAGRQAQQTLLQAAPSIIQAANADEMRFQRDLQDRNARVAAFGQQLAAGMSTLGAGLGTMIGGEDEAAQAATPAMPQQGPSTEAGKAIQDAYTPAPAPAAAPVEPTTPASQQAPVADSATPAAEPMALGAVPDLTPLGNQARMAESAQYLSRIGLSPHMALQLEEFVTNPFMNPLALVNPYKV